MQFTKATRKKARLRLALTGPSGSGKTMAALMIAKGLGGRVAVLDTEHGSASLYAEPITLANAMPFFGWKREEDARQLGVHAHRADRLEHARDHGRAGDRPSLHEFDFDWCRAVGRCAATAGSSSSATRICGCSRSRLSPSGLGARQYQRVGQEHQR